MSSLKARLSQPGLVSAPGVFDMISAKVADPMGFDALYMTGYGAVASYLGLPDAGLATYTDMVGRAGAMAQGCKTPLIADGDTGYGGLLNVQHTVRGYERAGVAGIQLEDQEVPKKCGHTPGRRVVETEEMVKKIKVAVETRDSDEFLIVARTDARTTLGFDEAMRRIEAYANAGADVLFLESPESEDEMARIGSSFDKPLVANMVEGGRTPILSRVQLEEMGFSLAIFPASGFLAAAAALQEIYRTIAEKGSTDEMQTNLYPFSEFSKLMGFQEVWDFEEKHADSSVRKT